MDPLLILAIGIVTILGLILILKVNAFLALIVSAIVVSLLSPGAVEDKISRVADSFGSAAGNIAIVIGLAAIIGECMMVSGAADRIVQAFLGWLGEKRASWALMGSGFVLSVPVFFDTVFYLLVPLARSLFRRTNKNYLLYILAIAAGGAITHTLVPPTPGPLVMATTLGIDIGTMILVGAMVALPAAIAGLAISAWLNKMIDIPFRDDHVVGTEDDVPEVPKTTPPLWLSLLPVVLPVALISANTALDTLANAEHTPQLQVADISDWPAFEAALVGPGATPAAQRIASVLPESVRELFEEPNLDEEQKQSVITAFNDVLVQKSPMLYDNQAFDEVIDKSWKIDEALNADGVSEQQAIELEREALVSSLSQTDLDAMKVHERERFNRLLLEVTFPKLIRPHDWNTPLRQAANVSKLFGNANLALLFSTIIAMWIVFRQKKPTLKAMSETVELALMSGGTIILITAAGGAFGAMLKIAGIGDAIKEMFTNGDVTSSSTGMAFLILGYSLAALLKVAQGSSTTAMIVGSGMLASMISGVELGFHPVYLATSIGAGSLMGSWMNDSGFWIFTKMGRLTESESLRSWTPMLAVLSLVSFATTILLSKFLPLLPAA
ncbi:High-affinity gluconate transporter [Thalassoglobus neptunius]|uniref:High-affinity gluconate transporter n=1 Tax=Thalassoglobus neptunius TaxID=1938619 RepID=A0A5C5X804_9PLAN|nr:SLC13 family permease [Thalassoglobus neptunius]TWT58461.1 High-affinity gluconate transporter [Thalassoglobus neptunius]